MIKDALGRYYGKEVAKNGKGSVSYYPEEVAKEQIE